jgi:putative DNA primase/helicase
MTQHPAIEFLYHLDPSPSARFNIEHYTDLPWGAPKPKPDPLADRYKNLGPNDVLRLLPELHEINEQGAGIFVARNQCQGHRSAKSVSRVRGTHADMDDVTTDQMSTLCTQLQPSIVVNSSGLDRHQCYWQLTEGEVLSKEEAKAINQTLVGYGADSSAVDVARLLRLPGFKHMKYRAEGRTPVVTAQYFDVAYSADEIRQAFPARPLEANPAAADDVPDNRAVVASQYVDQIAAAKAEVATKYPHLWTGNWEKAPRPDGRTGYPSNSEADLALAGHIARACRRQSIDEALLSAVVEAIFCSSVQGNSKKWLDRPDYRQRTIMRALADTSSSTSATNGGTFGLQLDSHGDVRNARAFAQIAKGRFLYVSTRDRWLRWTDARWLLCEKDEHVAQAKQACREILTAAGKVLTQDQERGKRLVHEAVTAHNLPRIVAMLKLATSEHGMAVTERELDGDPYLLGVQNGVVDLRTGHHNLNEPGMLITRYCNASYDEDAKCDRWVRFLDQVFEGDIETIESVQRMLGCTLLGLSGEEILVICYGHGSNGKSVFSNAVHTIMGGYAVTAPPSLLTARKANDNGPRNDIATVAGARYLSVNEIQAGDRLDEQVVKMLAGREPISARFLHQEFFEFLPCFTPWLRTNHKPVITGQDDGIWRRLVILRFARTFTDGEKDPGLEGKLLAERDGILRWMVDGAQKYLTDGLQLSPRMKAEWASYRKESDLLGEFLSDMTVPSPGAKVNQGSLYGNYRKWCEDDAGVRPISKKSFTQRLAERGYPEGKSGTNRFYCGLALASVKVTQAPGTLDRLDRIEGDFGISLHENSIEEETLSSPTSCPTCPTAPSVKECRDA